LLSKKRKGLVYEIFPSFLIDMLYNSAYHKHENNDLLFYIFIPSLLQEGVV
jgi:hypothetical protein